MSFLLRNIARYAAQKLVSNPRARETAAKAARVVVDEARQIARREDKARADKRILTETLLKSVQRCFCNSASAQTHSDRTCR